MTIIYAYLHKYTRLFLFVCLAAVLISALGSSVVCGDPELIHVFVGDLDQSTFDPSVVKPGVTPVIMLSTINSSGSFVSLDANTVSASAEPDIVVYSNGTVWYDVDTVIRASRNGYSLAPAISRQSQEALTKIILRGKRQYLTLTALRGL